MENGMNVLDQANKIARSRNDAFTTTEHVLLALCQLEEIEEIVEYCGSSIDKISSAVISYLDTNVMKDTLESSPPLTKMAQQLAEKAVYLSLKRESVSTNISNKKHHPTSVDILTSYYSLSEECFALYFLLHLGVTKEKVFSYIESQSSKTTPFIPGSKVEERFMVSGKYLKVHADNWTAMASAGMFDRLVGRSKEIDKTIEILCRKKKNNPIYIGDPGVGKTAIVQGLAQRIADGEVPDRAKDFIILSVDLPGMVAGTKWRGEFEARLKGVLSDIKKEVEKGKEIVIFMDEFHMVVGAGSGSESTMDAANIIKPALSDGTIKVIGATTYEEYKKHIAQDKAFARRFRTIQVDEPSNEETLEILRGLSEIYGKYHGIQYDEDALQLSIDLANRFVHDRKNPDKSIDIMDETGAHLSVFYPKRKKVSRPDIIDTICRTTGLKPEEVEVTKNDESLRNLPGRIMSNVFGQDRAIDAVYKTIIRSRAGISDTSRPIGSFIFAGPTGVGKTAMAQEISKSLGMKLLRFDMSEYSNEQDTSKLIGSSPGYIGYETGGQFTEAVIRHPHSVILLDEIEKAHASIFDTLLQVLDSARLVDNQGREANFSNSIIIMTSNLSFSNKSSVISGFDTKGESDQNASENEKMYRKQFSKFFRPEFVNRIDNLILFNKLNETAIRSIVMKFIRQIAERVSSRDINMQISERAIEWLAANGIDDDNGARPMQRLIQSEISDKIGEEILFGKISGGGTVQIDCEQDKLVFNFLKTKNPKNTVGRKVEG